MSAVPLRSISLMWTCLCSNKRIIASSRETRHRCHGTHFTQHPAHPRLSLCRFRKVGVVVGHIGVLTLLFTLPRSTRSISSLPRPGWTPACATTAAAPGCRLLPSTGKLDSLRMVVVKVQSSRHHNLDIGNNGVLGFKRLR